MKEKMTAKVICQEKLTDDIFSMWISAGRMASSVIAGQFLSVYPKDGTKLLPRPISICETDSERDAVRIVYRVTGQGTGTEEFSMYHEGDTVEIMGPLGNGFPTEGKKAFLIGGGIGIPPMLGLAKSLGCEKQIILGYRGGDLFLKNEFEKYGKVYVACEDGSAGTRGNVLDAICENKLDADVIYACGPTPMLRAIKDYAEKNHIRCFLSLEERMACGIGACLACVCESKEKDLHSHVCNKRVCKDGPVFEAGEVKL